MRFALQVIALLLASAVPAAAEEIVIGRGAICDTQKQVERLASLLDGGAEAAIESVNAEENNPTACAIATIAFVEGPDITITRGKNGTYRIVKVLVVGLPTPNGILATAPAAYFTIYKVKEERV